MRFFTHEIANPTGNNNGPSFDEWLTDFLVKSAEKEVKPCPNPVINNEGQPETTNDPQAEPLAKKKSKSPSKEALTSRPSKQAKCGKEMGESNDAGKVTETHTESGPGNDENPNPKVLINNDPNYQKPKTKKKNKKASSQSGFKKVAMLQHPEKLSLFAHLSSQKSNTYLPIMTAQGPSHIASLAYVESMTGLKFANMQEDEKKWFESFWKILYPEDYVKEMVKDR